MTAQPSPARSLEASRRAVRDEASMLALELLVAGIALVAAGLLSLAR